MEPLTNIKSLPDDLLLATLRRSFKQSPSSESYVDSLWTCSHVWSPIDDIQDQAFLTIKTPISAPAVAEVTQTILIASVCRRWHQVAKLLITTLSVKEDLVLSRKDLSAAVAYFPDLSHLHLSDNSVELVDDAFLAHLASSCPKLTALHVGRSYAPRLPIDLGSGLAKQYRRKEGHPITTHGLERFFRKLPELEQLILFCLHQETELPNSFFQLRCLHTLLLSDASALEKPGFTNLTALTTLYVSCPMKHLHLATLLHLPRLTHLSTSTPRQTHQPFGAANVTLSSCSITSLSFFQSYPVFDTIFSSTSPFTRLEELLVTSCIELVSLPDRIGDLLPCLRKLIIRNCYHFTHLPESFTSLSRLETFIVSFCDTVFLPRNFGHLPALKLLVLENLPIVELPPSFSRLTSLEALLIVHCRFRQQLPAWFFCRLTALKALCINSFELGLPENVGALARLEALRLYNYHSPLPPSFSQLSSLTSLELEKCGGDGLSEALGELSSMRELKIVDSSLLMLPSSLTRLLSLETLEVRGCRWLSELPPLLDTLVGLKSLVLTECRVLSSPPAGLPTSLETLCLGPFKDGSSHVVDISQLLQLRVLKLNCVGCTRLPCLQQLEELEQLEIRLHVDSRELPVPLTCLPCLRCLLIAAPGTCSLSENMTAALPELRQLELLSWSQELPGSIMGMCKLTSLTINAPRLVALPQRMSSLSRLRKLELIRCYALQHLPEFLTQLHQLILRDTFIRSLPENLVPAD